MRRWPLVLVWLPCLAGAADVEVPFDFLRNQIVLHATINGQGPYNIALDTGTHATTIDIRLAKRLRLPLGETERESTGAGRGRALARQTVLGELRVGDLTVRNLAAVALDMSKVSQLMGRPLHGVLGYGFLVSRVTQIDYFRRRIRFSAQSPYASTPRGVRFPLRFRENSVLPVLEECYLNGVKMALTLDTGSSLGLILFPQAIRRLGLEELAREGIPLEAAGYRGKAHLTKGWMRSVVLKTIDLGAIEVAYVGKGYGENESLERRGGNLGNAVLQGFVLTLDYPDRVVVLEAAEQ